MDQKTSQKTARIALFLIWLVLLLPIYTANALEIEFNPDVGVTVTQTTATIKWKTDINSTGTVKYGTTASDKEATTEEGMEHEAVLEELKSGTEYKYQIIAEAGEETARKPEIASQTLKFTTQSEADTTPPEAVKDLRVTEAAPWRIRFEWDIDAAKTPDVAYYRVYKDGEMIWDKHMAKYKTDEDLEKDKEYTYEVSAVDTSGNEGPKTSVKAKAAEPKTAIIVSDVKTEVLGTNVIITWLTNDNAHSRVKYSTNPLLLDKKAEESTFVKEHKVSITGLEPDKEYTFRAESCDSDGSCANSSAMTFKTTSKVELFLNVEDVDCRTETKKWFNANLITMKGKSAPGVNVTAYINGKEERTLTVAINGEFSFSGMRLDATKAENEVKIIADDRLGKKIECREMVMLDYRGPEVILDNATKNLKFSGKKDIRVGGNVTDENEITLYIYISSMDDTQGPLQVENLRNGSIEPNAVSIEWDAVKHPNKTQISESRPNYDQILDPYGTNPIGGGYGNPYGGGLGGAYSPYGQTYGAPAAGMTGAYGTPGYGTAPMVTGRAAFILESVFGNQMTGMQFLTGTSTESETYSYLIYRSDVSGGPIAEVMSPTLTFQDTNVSTATTYNYQVSAMDTAGNEGPRSAKLTVTTPPNGTVVPPRAKIVPKSPALKDTKKYMTTANKSVEFSEVINNLFDGRNNIKLVFEDVAGNKFEESFEVYVDSEVPKILWPTATDLQKWFSPAMTSEIKIDGQINKPIGEVWIYVNKNLQALNGTAMQPDKKVTVGPNGTWSADVELQTTVAATMMATFAGQPTTDAQYGAGQPYGGAPGQQPAYGQQGTYGQPGYGGAQQYQTGQYAQGQAGAYGQGQGTPTTVTLIAVDGLGRKSEPVTSQILYQPCAQGNYFQVEIKPGGNVINTRELLEGVAAYGFGYELKWQGGGMGHNVTVNRIDVRPATLGAKEASKYDSNWILGATPTFRQNNASKGFVLVNFRPQIPEGKTYFEREKNLSQHRKGECWKWAGCVRLMLQLDIQFRSPELAKQYAAQSSGAAGTFGASQAMQVPTSQRQCVELKIQLDERVDPSLIPKGLLQAAVVMINKTLMILDAIEKPLRYIAKITLGFCLLSFFSKFIIQAMRNYYCKYTSALGALSKGGGGIATLIKQGKMELLAKWDDGTEQGACTVEFADSDEAKETCKTCALWIQKEKWITDKWHLFCDRITCPPVPTLQHFIIQAYGTAKKPNPWRYVEEASARAARQCQKDVNLIKECICGMDPTSPTCKPGQRCGTDGKCADITPCVQNQFINEPFCRCTTVAGANAPNPQHLFCKRGQSCNDGQCRGTESTSLASVQTPGIRTAEIKCSQKSIGTSTYRCSITQTQWKKDHPHQKCEAANKCYPDKGLCTSELSAYYCVETAAELLGAVKGEEACYQWAADNKPGEKWSCGCLASKDAWTSSMCTEENNCTTQKCTGLKNNYYCCSVAAQRKKFGDQKCKDDNPGWSCQCRGTYAKPPGLWTSAECTKDGECKTEVCKLDYNDYFCCSDETKAKKAEFKGTTTTTGTSGQAGQSGSSSGSVPQTEASPQFQFPGSYIYTSQTAKGAQVALDCKPYSKTIGGTKSCYWRYADSAKQNPLVGSKVVIYTGKVWVATTSQGTTWGCQCTDYASALDIMNEKSNSKCSKNTAWCSSSDGRGDYCKYCGGTGGTGSAITDLDGESASLPVIEETEPSFNLITGMAMSDVTEAGAEAIAKGGMGNLITGMADPPKPAPATTPAQGQTTTSRTPAPKGAAPKSAQQATSTTSSGKPITTVARKEAPKLPKPRYDLVMPYEKGFYINPNWAMSKSDCQFADLGRSAIEEMYNFYTKGSAEEKKKCEKGHLYQPSCCPWEYMDAWQWGMMFQSEMKLSYCLSHPEAAECGTGTQITTGLTGICTPKGNAKRVQTVIVDGLKYKKDYPVGQRSKVNDDVAYMVDIDEKGTAQQVKRGYYSSSQVKGTIGTMDTEGRVAITTGTYLVPVDPNKDLAAHFPERDNADPSKDQDTFKEGMIEFGKDLCDEVNAKNIVGVGATGVSFVRMCGQYFAPGKQPTEVPKELEEQYRKIMYLLGEPTRQYLAQPAGNFIDSLLTLCLSAMISWMQHLRNFLRALQTCLLSIMLTGDGSAGQCRAIMSQYICDLLMKIISCIMNRMGAGGSGNRIGSGGIGGIFGAIHSASTGVIADANARYGNNNLFSTTFNAQNIAHDACIFMFTGEWPTDWKSLFEQAITMPINTTALVFPVTRRWQAYDANTGYAKYVYRIGYSISAGANIEFKLFLLASTRPNCPGNEPCDGSHDITGKRYTDLGRQLKLYIPHHQSGTCPTTGQLGQGKFCTDEVLYVHPQGLPLRYDQAGIEWRPFQVPTAGPSGRQVFQGTMVSPETVSGAALGDVREIGSPLPDAGCSFRISDLSYKCGIEVPKAGQAVIVKAEPVRPDNQNNPFEPGDSNVVRVLVSNELPKDATTCTGDCQYTKYLVIDKVMNHHNQKIYPAEAATVVGERINEAGLKEMIFMAADQWPNTKAMAGAAGEFKVKQEDFTRTTKQITAGRYIATITKYRKLLAATTSKKFDWTSAEVGTFLVNCEKGKTTGICTYEPGEVVIQGTKREWKGSGVEKNCDVVSGQIADTGLYS
ncbi:TPA: hypothetical protein HA265_03520, partial [Candidatus Woesearchaeota archaeon]|nr:hypothetical protein [Candidatus Woesearchaeota archaeon]